MRNRFARALRAACFTLSLCVSYAALPVCAAEEITVSSEDADLLIEDEGDVVVISEGDSLEQAISKEEAAAQEAAAAAQEASMFEDIETSLQHADPTAMQNTLATLLSQDNPTGSDGELEIGGWIARTMEQKGYTVSTQAFHEGFINDSFTDVPGVNIIAERGADSETRNNGILILCAHYDSKTSPAEDDPLANDKSGAAVLMEAADILKNVETDIDLCFLFLSGEEDGGYGAARMVESLEAENLYRIRGVLYVGTTGTVSDAPYLIGTQTGTGNTLSEVLAGAGRAYEGSTQEASEAAPPQTESGAQTGTEAETETASEAGLIEEERLPVLDDWTLVETLGIGCSAFAQAGLESVFFFQDVQGEFSYNEELRAETDVQALCKCADIVARTAVKYMTSAVS